MNKKRQPSPDSAERFRASVLGARNLFGIVNSNEEPERSRFYIETMEKFIAESESQEVEALQNSAGDLSAEDMDEFWQWNYPIHWEDIFGVRIRSSFVAQQCSHIEALLAEIAHRVQVIERSAIQLRHIKGTALEQAKLYYQALGRFGGLDDHLWMKMMYVFRLRNVHVHEQGYAANLTDDKKFLAFLQSLPNVRVSNNFIELRAGSCNEIVNIVEEFQHKLLAEYDEYRKRVIANETGTNVV